MKKLVNKIYSLSNYYNNLSKPALAGIWFLICNILQKGIVAITTPLFTRILSINEYGKVSIFYSWQDIISIFITLGLSSTVFSRGIVNNEEDKDEYTSIMLTLMSVITLCEFICYLIFHGFFDKLLSMSVDMVIMLFIYSYFTCGIDFYCQKKRMMYEYKQFVFVTLLVTIIRPVVSIIFIHIYANYKVRARIYSDAIVTMIIGMVLIVTLYKSGKRLFNHIIWKESLQFVLPLIPHYLSQRILSQSDRIMISKINGNSEAGIYSLAYSIGMLLLLFNSAIDNTMSPWVFRNLKAKNYNIINKLSNEIMKFMALISFCFILISPELVLIFGGEKYVEAIYLIPVIIVSSFFIYIYVQFIYVEYYVGKTKYVSIATVISACVNILLNAWAIKRYGYIAAAYTTLFCYIIYAIGHYYIMAKVCKEELKTTTIYNSKEIIKVSIVVIVCGLMLTKLYKYNLCRYLVLLIFILLTLYRGLHIINNYGKREK